MRAGQIAFACLALALASATRAGGLALRTGTDPETGLRWWRWQAGGVSVYLAQRLPDQTRAFFLARGFDRASVDRIAAACVLQLEIRNLGDAVVEADLRRWRTQDPDGTRRPLLLREHWEQVWQRLGLPRAQRIAFRWALFPSRVRYGSGDYNWGMILLGRPPGARVDLAVRLAVGGRPVAAVLPGIECAPDVARLRPEPP